MNPKNKLAEMPIRPLLYTMAVPLMLSLLIQSLYNIVDSIFVARLSETALTAASLVYAIQFLMIAIGVGTAVGLNALLSRKLGQKKPEEACRAATTGLFLMLGTSLVFTLVGLLFSNQIAVALTGDPELQQLCREYLSVNLVFCWGIFLQTYGQRLLQAVGDTVLSMVSLIIGAVVNIILDPIMIFGLLGCPAMGIRGAAIATVIGNVVSVIFFLIYFLRGKSILSISPGRYRVRGGIARGVITVGLPAAINSLLMSISNMLINVFLQAYGDNAVAAMGITMKANMLVVMLQLGLAQGVQPLVGYCYGANKLDRMRHSIRFSCVCNIVLGTVITVIYFIFTRQVVSVFIDDPAVIDYGVKMLRALMISGPVIGCMFVLNFSFQGMGKGTQSMILSLSRQGLIYFPLLIIMNKTVGLDGIIWSQAVADLVCTAMSVVMFLLVVRKLRRQHSQKTKA